MAAAAPQVDSTRQGWKAVEREFEKNFPHSRFTLTAAKERSDKVGTHEIAPHVKITSAIIYIYNLYEGRKQCKQPCTDNSAIFLAKRMRRGIPTALPFYLHRSGKISGAYFIRNSRKFLPFLSGRLPQFSELSRPFRK